MAQVNLNANVGIGAAATGGQTSIVNEPTTAAFFDEVFYTGNKFASHSNDGGSSWSLVNPFNTLPAPDPAVSGAFCCDQVTLHERNRNLWIWILQYSRNASSNNIFRIAVSTSGKPGPWTWWDFSPGSVDPAWSNLWFDYPHAATANDHLYVTYNMFDSTPRWQRAIAFKFPLDDLVAKATLHWQYYWYATHGSLRLAKGATSDMYFASHRGGSGDLRVWRWSDAPGGTVSSFDVTPAAWIGGAPGSSNPFTSPLSDGTDWLAWIDSRITGAWTTGDQAGFLWTANTQTGRPNPYVKAVVVDTTTQAIVAEPDIWDNNVAWAYPAACPNVDGWVGVSLFYGGGANLPTHVVGVLDGNAWTMAGTVVGTHGPSNNKWGDYLSCEALDPDGLEWVASGYTLQGGNTRDFIVPQYVRFSVS
jgi:hypothetical protein